MKRLQILTGLDVGLALFIFAVFKVYGSGEWYWFVLLAGSYPAALWCAACLGRMDGGSR